MRQLFLLNGNVLTPEQVVRISKNYDQEIDLTPQTWQKIRKSREAVLNMVKEEGKVVYGINTGFGNFANKVIPKQSLQKLQKNLILSHSVGVGNPLEHHQTRALLLLRINTLAKARSGISEDNLRKLILAFNKKFISFVPQKGTVGASGDLAPLSHLVLGLIGQGLAWDFDTKEYVQAHIVLQKLKLQPLVLQQKQGLALINGTQLMSAFGCQSLILAENILSSAQINLSFFLQLFGYPSKLLSEAYQQTIKNKTLKSLISRMRNKLLLNDTISPLYQKRMKDVSYIGQEIPKSIRYSLDSLAAAIDSLKFARNIIYEEINGATDNPLVYTSDDNFQTDRLISAGNFHGQYIAKAVDLMSISINSIGKYSDRRVERLVNGKISKMPQFLVEPEMSGINSGMMIMQYTSAALTSQNKVLVKPASVDSIPTSAGQEDHVSMGGYGSRKCLQLVKNVGRILAIQSMCISQAVGLLELVPCLQNVVSLQLIRQGFHYKKQDHYYGQHIELVSDLIFKGMTRSAK